MTIFLTSEWRSASMSDFIENPLYEVFHERLENIWRGRGNRNRPSSKQLLKVFKYILEHGELRSGLILCISLLVGRWRWVKNDVFRDSLPEPSTHGGHGVAGASFCIRTRRESIPVCGGVLQRKITFEGMANSRGQMSKNWHVRLCAPPFRCFVRKLELIRSKTKQIIEFSLLVHHVSRWG